MLNDDLNELLSDLGELSEVDELMIDALEYMGTVIKDMQAAIRMKNTDDKVSYLKILSSIGNDILFNPILVDPDSADQFELDDTIRTTREYIKKFKTESGDITAMVVSPEKPDPDTNIKRLL
jgi:hypothetical protein